MPETVSIDSPFYKGVIAGNRVIDETLPIADTEGADATAKEAMYWFYCGLLAHGEYGLEDPNEVGLFMVGAKTVAPHRPDGFTMTVETDGAAFRIEGGDDDGDLNTSEVIRILRHVTGLVDEGYERGPLYDSNGAAVGSWDLS